MTIRMYVTVLYCMARATNCNFASEAKVNCQFHIAFIANECHMALCGKKDKCD